jgi:hypothetical protein
LKRIWCFLWVGFGIRSGKFGRFFEFRIKCDNNWKFLGEIFELLDLLVFVFRNSKRMRNYINFAQAEFVVYLKNAKLHNFYTREFAIQSNFDIVRTSILCDFFRLIQSHYIEVRLYRQIFEKNVNLDELYTREFEIYFKF